MILSYSSSLITSFGAAAPLSADNTPGLFVTVLKLSKMMSIHGV